MVCSWQNHGRVCILCIVITLGQWRVTIYVFLLLYRVLSLLRSIICSVIHGRYDSIICPCWQYSRVLLCNSTLIRFIPLLIKLSQVRSTSSTMYGVQTITDFHAVLDYFNPILPNTHPQPPSSSRHPLPNPPSTSVQTAPAASQNIPC